MAWFELFLSPFGGTFLGAALMGIGSILAAVGCLLAFLGLARTRA